MLAEPVFRIALAVVAAALLSGGILFCTAQMGSVTRPAIWSSLVASVLIIGLAVATLRALVAPLIAATVKVGQFRRAR